MSRVAILIDGSNWIASLQRADLGYPGLKPLIDSLRGADTLASARFYAAPSPTEPFKGEWLAMQRANRHVLGLDFFQGYRNASGAEKVVDVAIGVDLVRGVIDGDFDRVDVVGGDGDILYAIKIAHERIGSKLRVHLAPGQKLNQLGAARIAFTKWTAEDLISIGAADAGARSPVPARSSAPADSPWLARILTGPFGKLSPSPAP